MDRFFPKKDVTPRDEIFKKGQRHLEAKQYEEALKVFDGILATEKTHEPSRAGKFAALIALANFAKEQKDWALAEHYLTSAKEIKPRDHKVVEELAFVRRKHYLARQSTSQPSATMTKDKEKYPIYNLVFQGGGIKGLAYLGALQELSQYINFDQIQRLGGTSAGGITAVLLGVGFSINEIEGFLKDLDLANFMDGEFRQPLLNLAQRKDEVKDFAQNTKTDAQRVKNTLSAPGEGIKGAAGLAKAPFNPDVKTIKQGLGMLDKSNHFGLFPGEVFRDWIESKLQEKTGIAYVTFGELEKLRKDDPKQFGMMKDIFLVGTNLSTQQCEIFSRETPDVIVSDALRITMSIPLVFSPHFLHVKKEGKRVKASNDWYVDGGLLDNYPIWLFDKTSCMPGAAPDNHTPLSNPHTLGFRLVAQDKKQAYESKTAPQGKNAPDSLGSYVWQLLETVKNKQESDHQKLQEQTRTVYIDHANVLTAQFNLEEKDKQALIKNGQQAVAEFFVKKYGQTKGVVSQDQKDSLKLEQKLEHKLPEPTEPKKAGTDEVPQNNATQKENSTIAPSLSLQPR